MFGILAAQPKEQGGDCARRCCFLSLASTSHAEVCTCFVLPRGVHMLRLVARCAHASSCRKVWAGMCFVLCHMQLICTLSAPICTLSAPICTLSAPICTLSAPICTLSAPIGAGIWAVSKFVCCGVLVAEVGMGGGRRDVPTRACTENVCTCQACAHPPRLHHEPRNACDRHQGQKWCAGEGAG